jgi:hypothetical protein
MSPMLVVRLAWPDVLERVRRSGFLLTVGTAVWLGSLVYTNNIQMWVVGYRGVVNSAWLGTVMALSATAFVSLAGFYMVKNTVELDRQTGVGQILAATRVSGRAYLLAKWLSNFTLLAAIVLTLAVAAVALHYVQAESVHLDVPALVAPLALLALPAMAVVAAIAVLFETVGWLSGGAGNVAYFFGWSAALTAPLATHATWADWGGFTIVETSLAAAVHAQAPGAAVRMGFTAGPTKDLSGLAVIDWRGIDWTPTLIGMRLAWILISALVVVCISAWFDRFDTTSAGGAPRGKAPLPAQARPWGRHSVGGPALAGPVWASLDWLVSARTQFGAMVVAELRLALTGVSRWWVLAAAGLWVTSLAAPMAAARFAHVAAWVWPLLLWSKMGVLESLHRTGPFVFSCPHPLRRQFAALWVSGVLIAAAMGSGLAVRSLFAGDWRLLAAWAAGVLFVPSLALALGVWTESTRAFEALYTAWWYVGPASRFAPLDYSGAWEYASAPSTASAYGILAAVLLATAILGRRRRMQG